MINVKDYGAIGDGTEQDRVYVQKALTAFRKTGGRLYFPGGTYSFTSPLLFENISVAITGDGVGITNLIWAASGDNKPDGIIFTGVSPHRTIRDISLLARGVCGTALRSENQEGPQQLLQSFYIAGETQNRDYWQNGIDLTRVRGTQISDFTIIGPDSTPNPQKPAMNCGIALRGSSVDMSITGGRIVHLYDGIFCDKGCEGLFASRLFINGRTGISLAYEGAGHAISDCHFANSAYGIYAHFTDSVSVHHNHFFVGDGAGVSLREGAGAWSIIGNKFWNPYGGRRVGIELIGSDCCVIQGNFFSSMESAIILGVGSTGCIIQGNRLLNTGGKGVGIIDRNKAPWNLVKDNLWTPSGSPNESYLYTEELPGIMPV